MDTLGEILGVLEQLEEAEPRQRVAPGEPSGTETRVVTDGGTFAHRRKVQYLDRLLARAERDGTFDRRFSPGYPPVSIDVAVDDDRGVVVVDDPEATVTVDDRRVMVVTRGRERTTDLPFAPQAVTRRRVSGLTAIGLEA